MYKERMFFFKKNTILVAIYTLFVLASCSPEIKNKRDLGSKGLKKILILTNSNGGGHNAASLAIKKALDDDYEVEIFDILKDKILGESLFSYTSRNEYWKYLEYLIKLKKISEFINNKYNGRYIAKEITGKNPDLLISVFPIGIKKYKEVADLLDIPYIVVPTDFNGDNLSFYDLDSFENDKNNAKKFRLFLPFKDDKIDKAIDNKTIFDSVRYIGYPVRKDFLAFGNEYRKNNEISIEVKQGEYIGSEDKTILITMGANSWTEAAIIKYVNIINDNFYKIMQNKSNILHVYVICGTNEGLLKKISNIKIKNPDLLKIHTEKWIDGDRIAKLMSISDIIIAKPGGSTVAEILSLGKYVIFKPDSTIAMPWEKSNMLIAEKYNLASEFKYNSDFNDEDFIKKIVNGFNHNTSSIVLPPINNFYLNIKKEIDELFC